MAERKLVAIVQARMGSTRLPGKVLKEAAKKPLLMHMLERIRRSALLDQIVLATSDRPENAALLKLAREANIEAYAGSETDVLDRYYQAARKFNAAVVVRLTGDCPLIDPRIVDKVIYKFLDGAWDYVSNVEPPTFPDGLDTEVFGFPALETAWRNAAERSDREHVTPYLRREGFKRANVACDRDLSRHRWTVDEPEDLAFVRAIFDELYRENPDFSMEDVLALQTIKPQLFELNKNRTRNEGMTVSTGVKLWGRAKNAIAGGNMLLSKRPDMFLPGTWPSYFERSKGIEVWDMDGNRFIDMSIMGIGTNVLGYANDEVNAKVIEAVNKGTTSTLNCPEEVYLAEKLIELHPWADMARFTRAGGEAVAVAVRIARAASGKDGIAFCGYHGWHDWYLAANLADDKNLDGQLLPGLEPRGVPRGLQGTARPFFYNQIEGLERIVQEHEIGTIVMEPIRNHEPQNGFLQRVREIADRKGIILIFDEITSGFRRELGGIHRGYGVNPDLAVLGKAMGNGYAIGAVIGKKEVMEAVQSTFISSTYWTERIGPVAALETIRIMERDNVCPGLEEKGKYAGEQWLQLGAAVGLSFEVEGLPALSHFNIRGLDGQLVKTYITQEMLKRGYLAATSLYVCDLHTREVIDRYIEALAGVLTGLKRQLDNGRDLRELLEGPVCQSGFKRLT